MQTNRLTDTGIRAAMANRKPAKLFDGGGAIPAHQARESFPAVPDEAAPEFTAQQHPRLETLDEVRREIAWLYRAVRDGVRVGMTDCNGQVVKRRIGIKRAALMLATLRAIEQLLLRQ